MGPSATVDAFHRGRFHLVQPASKGHRSGIDAMLLAGAVPTGFRGRAADFGAGAGAAGLAVATRCAEAHVTLVERSAEMSGCARASLDLPENQHLAPRIELLKADVALPGQERVRAGLSDRSFDFIIMNPPFNAVRDRATPDPLKREAHVMTEGLFEKWLRTAAAVARPGAEVAVIARPVSLPELLAALGSRFGGAEVLPIHPRQRAEAIRIIIRARQGSRAGLRLLDPLILHGSGRDFTERAEAVINGQVPLFR